MKKTALIILVMLIASSFAGGLFADTVDVVKKMKLDKPYQYYKIMGDRFRVLGDYSKSVKNYEFALALNRNCAECYLFLAKLKYEKNLYIDSIKELEIGIKKEFQYPFDRIKAYYLLAVIYFKINKDGRAVEVLKKLTEEYEDLRARSVNEKLIDPLHYAPAYLLIGLYYRNNAMLEDSNLKYFYKAIELNYKKDFCNFFIYEYYKAKNMFDVAFRYLNQAITINANVQQDLQEATWVRDYIILDDLEN